MSIADTMNAADIDGVYVDVTAQANRSVLHNLCQSFPRWVTAGIDDVACLCVCFLPAVLLQVVTRFHLLPNKSMQKRYVTVVFRLCLLMKFLCYCGYSDVCFVLCSRTCMETCNNLPAY